MNIKELLPIGSVVLLNNGKKKLMIFGIKQVDLNDETEYDYVGVVYPEGNLGEGTQFLFNQSDIAEVYFKGYEDEERDNFIENLSNYFEAEEMNNTDEGTDEII